MFFIVHFQKKHNNNNKNNNNFTCNYFYRIFRYNKENESEKIGFTFVCARQDEDVIQTTITRFAFFTD